MNKRRRINARENRKEKGDKKSNFRFPNHESVYSPHNPEEFHLLNSTKKNLQQKNIIENKPANKKLWLKK
jgi:hypothetical protein